MKGYGGRIAEYKARESQVVTLPGGERLDLCDRSAVLTYYRRELASSLEPTVAQLQRLDRLLELAMSLPEPRMGPPPDKAERDDMSASIARLEDARRRRRQGDDSE